MMLLQIATWPLLLVWQKERDHLCSPGLMWTVTTTCIVTIRMTGQWWGWDKGSTYHSVVKQQQTTKVHHHWVAMLLSAMWHLQPMLERWVWGEVSSLCPCHVIVIPHCCSIIVVCSSKVWWNEHATGGTYHGVLNYTMTMNNECWSLFIVSLPHRCPQHGTCIAC